MTNDRIKAMEDALRPFSRMAQAMFARNWERDGVAISLVEKDGPIRLTFADFLAAHQALDASQPTPEVRPGAPITLTYTNWKGETAERAIIPRRVWWGSTEWHPEPQWLLTAFGVDKQAERDFALKDFCQPVQPVAVKVKPLAWTATCDAGDFMAYDPLFERQVLSLEPAAYDTERVDRIMAALDVQPMTVQDAARVLWEAYKGLRDKDWKDCTEAERGIKIMDSAGLRAIAEGRA